MKKAGGDVISLLKSCVPPLTNHSGVCADTFVSHLFSSEGLLWAQTMQFKFFCFNKLLHLCPGL